jgi:Domain of unknown function (DUF1707)
MDSQCGPPLLNWYGGPRRNNWSSDPNMRVSDAERTEMADTLSKHYADGRLDDSEFKMRLDKAMGAKTRADLNGLLVDLPPINAEEPVRRPGIFRRAWWAFMVFCFVALAIAVTSSIVSYHVPWLLIALVLFFVWRSGRFHHRQHHRDLRASRY